jgi:hypothetical protein
MGELAGIERAKSTRVSQTGGLSRLMCGELVSVRNYPANEWAAAGGESDSKPFLKRPDDI